MRLAIDMIVHDFTVDLNIVGMNAYNAVGVGFWDQSAISSMPRAVNENGKIFFFRPGKYLKFFQPKTEAARRGLRLVDPHTLLAFNSANPKFRHLYPNATVWWHNGKECFASCEDSWMDSHICVAWINQMGENGWTSRWWFAGFAS